MSRDPSALENLLLDHFRPLVGKAVTQKSILATLGTDEREKHILAALLRDLVLRGRIIKVAGNRFKAVDEGITATGVLMTHPQGFGYLVSPTPLPGRIVVQASEFNGARHRDKVIVRAKAGSSRVGSGRHGADTFSGEVIQIIERGSPSIVGLLHRTPRGWLLTPDDPRFRGPIPVATTKKGPPLRDGHKFLVALADGPESSSQDQANALEDLGPVDAEGVDMLSVLRAHGLSHDFPEDVIAEATDLDGRRDEIRADKDRRDITDWVVFTIDPEDARDHDDAVSLRRNAKGHLLLGVHIADVARYVPPDSALDREARLRSSSAYLVDQVVPMLPPVLTTDICSLVEGQDRAAHSVEIEYDAKGKVRNVETFSSIIRSRMKMSYDQLQRWMDTGEATGFPQEALAILPELRALGKLLRKKRMENGALGFEFPEVRCVLNDKGEVVGVSKRMPQESYQLIEEFMLAANVEVAHIIHRAWPEGAMYRIHEEPSERQWNKMADDLKNLGVNEKPDTRRDINRLIEGQWPDHLKMPVTLAMLRNMNRAVYSAQPREHFGLAFDFYTHFTSPIRRYPDLVVHRLLCAAEKRAKKAPADPLDLEALAIHCSDREQRVEEAEKESIDIKKIAYYRKKLEAGDTGPFDAVITAFNPRGIMIELTDTLQRGLVAFNSMGGDYYVISPDGASARGQRTGRTWHIGQNLAVLLARVDSRMRLVDFVVDAKSKPPADPRPRATEKRKATPRRPESKKGKSRRRS